MFECGDEVEKGHYPLGVAVHRTAIVSRGAELGQGVIIGPFALVGPKVVIKDGARIGSHVVLEGRTTIGARTEVHSFASLGTAPQDLKYKGQDTELIVGDDNKIREYVNISIGTDTGGGRTTLGNDNLIMAYTHIAHDSIVGNECIFANGVQLAGHVHVADRVVFGGMSGGHQFSSFGEYAMVGAGAIVVQDVPPYCMVQGDRASISGLNVVGLRRAAIKDERLDAIKNMFRLVFKSNLTLDDAIQAIEREVPPLKERDTFVGFLKVSRRGICR